ncbi:hypothetical protein FP3_000026 [Pasteurella phage vB_PmuM_CFP3]|uniref:Uncharacterized protein n=1 Tax=Pasteurella phage vB_PmuM_CFP3 TaxID=3017169 RepID=A0AAF0B8E4_9CAUD|nr:hypothetical protein AAUPMG_12096 [Pasteurella multocida subsp. multocida str. Anand1_goat]WBY65457.1 hypothetical protein FP3_000026 [Pasteurella phage vB_PmuM_CFP3]
MTQLILKNIIKKHTKVKKIASSIHKNLKKLYKNIGVLCGKNNN